MGFLDFEIRFHGPLLLGGVLAAAAAWSLLVYARFLREIKFPGVAFPLLLRSAALLGTIVMILGPVIYFSRKAPVQRSIAVLLDVSQSMGVADERGASRMAGALEDMKEISGGLRGGASMYSFGETLSEIPGVKDAAGTVAAGKETMLRPALASVMAKGDRPPTDLVLLSDGADTSGLEAAPGGAARIHSLVYGDAKGFINAGLSGVRAPEYGFVDVDYVAAGKFYCAGAPEGAAVGIELFEDGIRVARTAAKVAGGEGEMYGFSLSYVSKSPGMKAMELRVKTEGEGPAPGDNSYRFFADIISERHRVLLIDSPSWEFKFLKDFLREQSKPVLDVVLVAPEKEFRGSEIRKVLSSPGELGKYRLVIAGRGAGYLAAAEKNALAGYLKGGGRMVVLGGPGSLFLAGGGWSEILGADGGGMAGDADGFEATLTEAGAGDSLLRVEPGLDANAGAWKTLPFVQTFNKASAPAGGVALAVHPWMKCAGKPCPLIYRREVSGGRLLAVAFQGLWRWKFVEKRPEYYDRLWENILEEFLETEKSRPVRIVLSEDTIVLSEKTGITVKVAEGILKEGEKPEVRVSVPGAAEPVLLEPAAGGESGAGTFYVEYTPGKLGVYEIAAAAGGRESEPALLAVNVSPDEYVRVAPDGKLLKSLAVKTGGVSLPAGGADKLLDELKKNVSYETVRGRSAPWASAYFLIFITAALTAEWILRRRGGLT